MAEELTPITFADFKSAVYRPYLGGPSYWFGSSYPSVNVTALSNRTVDTIETYKWARDRQRINLVREISDKQRQAHTHTHTRTPLARVVSFLGSHRQSFYESVQQWAELYSSGDSLVHETGKTFAAVTQLIDTQFEMLHAATEDKSS
eukprot:Gregarina_sp_Pseudo_9__3633@NODE_378_length_3004_cov_6_656324_g357_i0_p4_GENE_NODE_378_length_3004_cov_6_656324_g357_i0NODE_378_length_3004_cov_6_656324_g357_i0_p4_ORF_typecomplete_len147_score24_42CorA/PF01544_18/0_037MIPT3_C/PF17749_1/0_036_NODE_378_length_3004_cov_6_656324_g357_i07421182